MRLLRRRREPNRAPGPPAVGPRIALWGTFDIADYSTLLLPRIYERELLARLPLAQIDVYAPLGFEHPVPLDGGRPSLPLGGPSEHRKRQLARLHDLVIVSGDVVHTRDDRYGELYGSRPQEPSGFFVDGLGEELERQCPIVWSAIGVPFAVTADEASRVKRAADTRAHVSVRDDGSLERLLATGTEREIIEVPDPTVLAARVFPPEVLRKRLDYLRMLGSYPAEGRPVVVDGAALTDVAREVANEAVVMLPRSDETAAAFPGQLVFRLPAEATVEDITAAIAHARAVVGTDVTAVALGFGIPALGNKQPAFDELERRLDAELDTIAELAERSWSRRVATDETAAVELAQAVAHSDERYRALLQAHTARGERLLTERMRFAEIVDGLERSGGALPAEAALRIAELENAIFTAEAAEAEARFELEQLRQSREPSG